MELLLGEPRDSQLMYAPTDTHTLSVLMVADSTPTVVCIVPLFLPRDSL